MNILIVDDELLVRTGVHSLIPVDDARFTVAGDARSGEEALTLIPALQPVIVISDIVMPGMTGLELLNRCRDQGYAIAFVFLTSHRDFEYARQAVEMGATDYLLKHELHPRRLASVLDRAYRSLEAGENRSRAVTPVPDTPSPSGADSETRLLLVRIEQFYRTTEQRDAGAIGSLLITMVQQVSGSGIRIALDSSVSGLWCFQLRASPVATTAMASRAGRLRFGSRLVDTLRTSMNLSARIGISLPVPPGDRGFFDRAFCTTHSVIMEEDGAPDRGRANGTPTLPQHSDPDSAAIAASVRKLLRLIEQRQSEALNSALSEFEALCRDVLAPRESMILDAATILNATHTALARMSGSHTANADNPFATLQRTVRDAAYSDTIIRTLAEAFELFATLHQSAERTQIPEEIARVREFIHREYRRAISLEEAASVAGKSPTYFSTLFHRSLGVGFVEYVNRVRIDAAVSLLRDPRTTIAEVGAQCGFPNDKYFARTFKRVMGFPPGSVRSKNRAPDNDHSRETR